MRARAAESPRKGRLILWTVLCLLGPAILPAFGADTVVHNNFGSVGMIDMPSARMAPDGEFSIGASFFQNTQHYNFGFQILPWLETSFRYSGLSHFDPAFPVYYDRSFAVKARLWDETADIPALAVGVDDVVGTGIYSGEYLVASKRFGNIDASLGMGWGRLGSTDLFRNPLRLISPTFNNRVGFPNIAAGSASLKTFFHGPSSGLFGGLIWHTPIDRLSLIAEYSSDEYKLESARGNFKPQNQLNFGASYQVADGMAIGLDWLYGRSIGGNILFQFNPAEPQYSAKIGSPPPPEVAVRTPDEQQQALKTMLAERRGTLAQWRRTNASRAEFVDALWREDEVSDAQLRGRSLILTASGNTGRRCILAAQLAENFGSIATVVVRDSDGANAVQCVTADASAPAYQTIASPDDSLPSTHPCGRHGAGSDH